MGGDGFWGWEVVLVFVGKRVWFWSFIDLGIDIVMIIWMFKGCVVGDKEFIVILFYLILVYNNFVIIFIKKI